MAAEDIQSVNFSVCLTHANPTRLTGGSSGDKRLSHDRGSRGRLKKSLLLLRQATQRDTRLDIWLDGEQKRTARRWPNERSGEKI